MDSDASRLVELILPNGAIALARAIDVDGGGANKTGIGDRFDVEELTETGHMTAPTAVDRIVAGAFRAHDARNVAAARA